MNCPTCDATLRTTHTRPGPGVIRRRRCCPRCNFIGWTVEAFESDDIAAAAKARRELRRIAEAVSEATERMSAITGMK